MPKHDGSLTRSEGRALNKTAHALAWAEQRNRERIIPLDAYRDEEGDHLPPELVNGSVLRRIRGDLTDEACVNRICELFARGVTIKKACKHIGVPPTLWGEWLRNNTADINTKYEFARKRYLDQQASEIFDLVDELRRERTGALKSYNAELRTYRSELALWNAAKKSKEEIEAGATDDRGPRPVEPVYDGPQELDVRIVEMAVRHRQWNLELGDPNYMPKTKSEQNVNVTQNIYQSVRDAPTAEEGMKRYSAILDLKPE